MNWTLKTDDAGEAFIADERGHPILLPEAGGDEGRRVCERVLRVIAEAEDYRDVLRGMATGSGADRVTARRALIRNGVRVGVD